MSKTLIPHAPGDVIVADPINQAALIAYGTTVPTDATPGYQPGCLFIQTDGSNDTTLYTNEGSVTSCDFNPVKIAPISSAMTAALTTITPADAEGTPDYAIAGLTNSTAYGFASLQEAVTILYVIKNLQTRMAEVEAALEANGIVTAN